MRSASFAAKVLMSVVPLAEGLGLNLSELVDFDTKPLALADPKGNEFTATPRKGAHKPAKRAKPSS
jgi:hypothetical protein